MKACYHEYFKENYGKFVCLTLVMGVLSILSSYNLDLQFNENKMGNKENLELSFSTIIAIALYLTILLTYLMNKNFQSCGMKIAFVLIMINDIFWLVIAGIVASLPLFMGNYIAFGILLAFCLFLCSPIIIQLCICLEFFELAKLERELMSNGEKETQKKELVVKH